MNNQKENGFYVYYYYHEQNISTNTLLYYYWIIDICLLMANLQSIIWGKCGLSQGKKICLITTKTLDKR